jgi:hypothetical protein
MQHILEMSNQELESSFTNLFIDVIFNWNTIKQNGQIMSNLDMQSNNLCRQLKIQNPTMRDCFIQARVFTITLILVFSIITPIRNVFDSDGSWDYLLHTNNNRNNGNNINNINFNMPSVD